MPEIRHIPGNQIRVGMRFPAGASVARFTSETRSGKFEMIIDNSDYYRMQIDSLQP